MFNNIVEWFSKMFGDNIIMVTGGTGSFGYKLLQALIDYPYKEIRIFSRDELKQD